ncbi:MAG: hypothetical protein CMJ81_01335 [Planctomycetaceae bacterium]|nr:hypothetical protein [Planctomycetaceae bacterium]
MWQLKDNWQQRPPQSVTSVQRGVNLQNVEDFSFAGRLAAAGKWAAPPEDARLLTEGPPCTKPA